MIAMDLKGFGIGGIGVKEKPFIREGIIN